MSIIFTIKQKHLYLALGFVMCSQTIAATLPVGTMLASKQELVRNNSAEPVSLDPQKVESDVEFNIISDFFDGLVSLDGNGKIEPRLADRWENKNNVVWIFHLRPGIKWSNGEPITAQDVVFSWRRLVNPKTLSPNSSYLGNMHVLNAADIALGKKTPDSLGIEALDDHTLQITLDQPIAYFLPMLARPLLVPINQKNIEKFGEKWTSPSNIVTSGAYKLSQWVVNEKIIGIRNQQYWDDTHTIINRVTYLPIVSDTASVNRYKAGEIDISTISDILFKNLQQKLGTQVHINPQLSIYYYEFNTTKPPFNDPRVRLALNLGLDKDIIANKVLGEGQRPAWLITPVHIGGMTFKEPDYANWSQEKRNLEAKKLLEQAGFNASHPLTFKLLYNTSEGHQRIAIAANSIWKKNLGVEATLENQEWKTLLDTKRSKNYDVIRSGWTADYDDASSFLNNFITNDSNNSYGFSNVTFDDLMKQASQTTNIKDREILYQKAEDVLTHEIPAIPIYEYVTVKLVKPYVGGFKINNLGFYYTKDMYIIQH